MLCNIDRKGRLARLIWGVLCLLAGAVMVVRWARPGGGWVAWVVTGVVLFAGAFGVFEWWAGWCVVRAMGVKTRF